MLVANARLLGQWSLFEYFLRLFSGNDQSSSQSWTNTSFTGLEPEGESDGCLNTNIDCVAYCARIASVCAT